MMEAKPHGTGLVDTTRSPHAALRPLPFTAVRLEGGFWSRWQSVNGKNSLAHGHAKLIESGVIANFQTAAGRRKGGFQGAMFFSDTDLYKWLEAASYELAGHPGEELSRKVDDAVRLIADAQMDDGYLDTFFQIGGMEDRWKNPEKHALYCAGHLIQAAVAHVRCTGSAELLEVAVRLADHLDSIFGWGKLESAPGHPEVEMALVELYRATGERRYLDLARYFIDVRGRNIVKGGLFRWDRVPIRDAVEAAGHAVMQVYLLAGATDVYLETGDRTLLDALVRLWEDTTSRKMSINGGVGVNAKHESFERGYQLPNEQVYNETCAQIASAMWNWRMLLATGEARYADLMERTLYNGILCGVSLDGTGFFYGNTLFSRSGGRRSDWDKCACCPPNVMRTLASVHATFATVSAAGLQIHLYDSGRISADLEKQGRVDLRVETRYPWEGTVLLTVEAAEEKEWDLSLRIPQWCGDAAISVNGEPMAGNSHDPISRKAQPADTRSSGAPSDAWTPGAYAVLRRGWRAGDTVELRLPMHPVRCEAHPLIEPTRCCLALGRGPLIYCIEECDQPAGSSVLDCTIDPTAEIEAVWKGDLLEGVMTLKAPGFVMDRTGWEGTLYREYAAGGDPHRRRKQSTEIVAVPYYSWANREPGPMRVWIPVREGPAG